MSNPPLKLVLQPILDALNRGVSPTWFDLGDAAPGPLVAGDVSPGFAITNAIEQAIGKLNDMELTAEAAQLGQFINDVDECDGDKAIPLDELRDWLNQQGLASPTKIPSQPTVKKPKVDDLMKAELAANLQAANGWTAKQWADHLGCGQTAVKDTETWKSLNLLRQQMKAEKRRDRHGTKSV
jgi:hypothetical protein